MSRTIAKTTTLVLGGTGATGKHLIHQLLDKEKEVRAIVRSKERLIEALKDINHDNLLIIEGTVLDMSDDEMETSVRGCDVIVSCLGHNLTFQGMFGKPHKLVKDSIKRVCDTVVQIQSSKPTKVILMGSNGVSNPDGSDDMIRPITERVLLGLLRLLIPPVADNEHAAMYLSKDIGHEEAKVEWVVVRPNDLIDGEVSEYEVLPKPVGSLFGGGVTTRSNVAAFMGELILDDTVWKKWLYKMPVPQNVNVGQAN